MSTRITGGSHKGRVVQVAAGRARYTSSKVRKAIFDRIGDVTGWRVLELFAGSAAFSLEALSRGAALCAAVEKDALMARMAAENARRLSLDRGCFVLHMDVIYAVPFLWKRGDRYDLLFADPPYEKGHVAVTLDLLKRYPLQRDTGLLVVEHSRREIPECPGLGEVESRRYGDTVVSFLALT